MYRLITNPSKQDRMIYRLYNQYVVWKITVRLVRLALGTMDGGKYNIYVR